MSSTARRRWAAGIVLFELLFGSMGGLMSGAPQAAEGAAEGDDAPFQPTEDPGAVIVKFRDGSQVRWASGAFRDGGGPFLELEEKDGRAHKVSRVFDGDVADFAAERARLKARGLGRRPHLELYYTSATR